MSDATRPRSLHVNHPSACCNLHCEAVGMAPPSVIPTLSRELVLSLLPPLRQDPVVLKQVTDHIARDVKADVQGSSRLTWEEVDRNVAGWVVRP